MKLKRKGIIGNETKLVTNEKIPSRLISTMKGLIIDVPMKTLKETNSTLLLRINKTTHSKDW